MKFLKHYWVNRETRNYLLVNDSLNRTHPIEEFPELDVKFWLQDKDGIDVCVSVVPDYISVEEKIDEKTGKKLVQILTIEQMSTLKLLHDEIINLRFQIEINMKKRDIDEITRLDQVIKDKLKEMSEALESF